MKGHVGEILRIDLTTRTVDTLPTSKYEQWVGGTGMGTALFWDEVDKEYLAGDGDTTGFEPENVVCIVPGVLTGTLAPSGGRTEVCGLAPEAYPKALYTRGNFGGRFGPMLKYAGFDAVVIKGKADSPVWIDIRDKDVQIKDAKGLWGLNTYETQEDIWQTVSADGYGDWYGNSTSRDQGRTTQRSAVLTMGALGEKLGRIACLIHDAGNAVGQGGFGAVFGSKNLKAISVIGTGDVEVANPKALIEARKWLFKYAFDTDTAEAKSMAKSTGREFGNPPSDFDFGGQWTVENAARPLGCYACPSCSRTGYKSAPAGLPGGESQCVEAVFYLADDIAANGKTTVNKYIADQLLQVHGINAYEMWTGLAWLQTLAKKGLLGPGKQIETSLDFLKTGSAEWAQEFIRQIVERDGIGDDLADGMVRSAAKWGVLEESLLDGTLPMIYNIGEVHWGDDPSWAFQSLFHTRDLNQHDISRLISNNTEESLYSAEKGASRLAGIAAPWHDEMTADRSEAGVYSEAMARCVAWGTRHVAFWKNSAQFCDQAFPSWFNTNGEEQMGATPELEVKFFEAVTGEGLTYEDGLELGRKIWNFERAILCMQGRHREQEYFPPYPPYNSYVHTAEAPFLQKGRFFTVNEDDKWLWKSLNFAIEKDKFDEFKSLYYRLEGWDEKTGRPTRETLEEAGLKQVADELESRNKLGAS
ncbi:MAG: aldehyde ferredoxin oxidoreductase N-terminal domain-containing protein [Coriobacteriia bacterium]